MVKREQTLAWPKQFGVKFLSKLSKQLGLWCAKQLTSALSLFGCWTKPASTKAAEYLSWSRLTDGVGFLRFWKLHISAAISQESPTEKLRCVFISHLISATLPISHQPFSPFSFETERTQMCSTAAQARPLWCCQKSMPSDAVLAALWWKIILNNYKSMVSKTLARPDLLGNRSREENLSMEKPECKIYILAIKRAAGWVSKKPGFEKGQMLTDLPCTLHQRAFHWPALLRRSTTKHFPKTGSAPPSLWEHAWDPAPLICLHLTDRTLKRHLRQMLRHKSS